MEIVWYGHACFRLRGRGCAVVTDPYPPELGYQLPRFSGTIATVSHDGSNHNQTRAVRGKPYVIDGPGEYEVGGVFVTGVATNPSVDKAARNTAYLIEIEGILVCHMGVLDALPSQEVVEALDGIDILLLPVGGRSVLTPAKAADVVSVVEPAIVIPMLYASPDLEADLGSVKRFLSEMAVEAVEPIAELKITKSQLPEPSRIVVLDPRR